MPSRTLLRALSAIESKNFAHVSDERERKDKTVIQLLEILKLFNPHREREFKAWIEEIKEEVARNRPQSSRDAVFEAVCNGCGIVSEIVDRTELTEYTVRKWLNELCALKLVEKRSQGKVVECGGLHVPELYVAK